MRLTTIKLAGFKSFVDPTTLHLPTNMTGVVGPNGCGKSNIIDAVRWVMGESSASRLRGDSLTDVIFSGSSARKPVGQATVELIFDNSDGTVSGEFARFNEISVKRLVSRDGQSAYYLNGTRCRRRDITDLFLGTGLGPRSYSIIEQGMISQIIEARPEDLRVYLEEAAGISKYKERRRETENRIRHTRENLDRLNDVREEVGKQLEHLKRQARQAEQYQQLKAEQRELQAQLHALEWRQVDGELGGLRDALRGDEVKLEALVAEQRHAEHQIELCRGQREEAQTTLSNAQAESYRVGAEIARLEQQVQHQRELLTRLQRANEETAGSLEEVTAHLSTDQEQIDTLVEQIELDEPALVEAREAEQAALDAVREVEAETSRWQQRWDALVASQAETGRSADVGRARIEMLEKQAADAATRIETLGEERAALDLDALGEQLQTLAETHEQQQASLDTLGEELEARKQGVLAVQEEQRQRQHDLNELRKSVQSGRGRLASLEALQHAALGQESGGGLAWVQSRGLADAKRLGETLEVEPGWELAVETALGALLEAVLVDGPAEHIAALAELSEGRVALVDAATRGVEVDPASLAARVKGPDAVLRMLAGIRRLDSAEDAAAHCASDDARPGIDRHGLWSGAGWARLSRSAESQQGTLAREREIQRLREELDALSEQEMQRVDELNGMKSRLLEAEQQREDAQRALYLAHRAASELGGELQALRGKLDNARSRSERIDSEIASLRQASQQAAEAAREARAAQAEAVERMAQMAESRPQLEAERDALHQRREQSRQAASAARDQAHRLALQLESQRSRLAGLRQAVERLAQQRTQLEQRRGQLAEQLAEGDSPIKQIEQARQAALEQRVVAEKDLANARSALDGIENELRNYESQRQKSDQAALALRDSLAQRRLAEQAAALKAQALVEHVTELERTMEDVLASLPEDAQVQRWRQRVGELETRIRRLEPVNLAAIQEYGEQSQRKEYLDAQHADLTAALETLEDAIRKIDRETRGRFKDTFDRVNTGIQELYPRLFGGGHAYLELTGDDLLDTGVSIMARPPGKRVSNISLLSGGEKALTAVALVFAIFRLNPAPFCLLDEVDAPLDEANVGRFCNMVSEMSEKVQFLFVSHNKATMEAAQQLAGVTMREPGVSRLVSVDLAEAARLAGAA
ncbi:chromosome segregation protein SMC [Pseudomarimonas salicorniae]|uniref:Chromosome partition protein Smc n=1 Tax=Pseudomarimonas salicorniae TaxID=2933270 RepID=A0ABT0GLA3_9GAMM|nr:chromosome segregation protein SMC [Lysobacter sp. CAU 1642]MCK7595213.1 chromosome segregation protein SMC [Lysobacter sp. CAU 1642]